MISARIMCTLFGIIFIVATANGQMQSLRSLAEWKELEYEFPSESDRDAALANGAYVRGNGVPIDVAVDYKRSTNSRVFVTVPRFSGGIPITLGTLSGLFGTGGPIIRPYPNYDWSNNQGQNCDGFTSVFRIAIDECRRLWVLDSGKVGDVQSCQPQLVVFDLDTDRVVRQYKFPQSQYKVGSSLFITPLVDVRDATPGTSSTCPNTMVYVADVNGFGLIVYSFLENRSWRAQNKNLYPSPAFGTFTIVGESFDLMDGVFSMAATPLEHGGERMLYFHSLASITENAIALRLLDNCTIWEGNPDAMPRAFLDLGNRGAQSSAEAMDRNGNLFFALISPIGIGCWDSQRSYGRDAIRVVVQNEETLQFASGMKIVLNGKGNEELWVLTNRFQKVMTGSISTQEVNFRIQAVEVQQLLNGQTKCSAAGLPSSAVSFPRY